MKLDSFYLKTAILLANESSCISKKVGCVIVKDGKIISMGYNGTPAGFTNCNDHFNNVLNIETHHLWSNIHEIHAEMNAILYAAKSGISILDSTLYCTLHPCNNCLKNIIQTGIKRIVYLDEYHKTIKEDLFMKFISDKNILLEQYINKELDEFKERNIRT